MSGSKKRRVRSSHPGVVLIPPSADGRHPCWRARFTDVDTGRKTWLRLDPVALRTADARRDWAIRKSQQLARDRMDRAVSGVKRLTRKPIDEAVAVYLKAAGNRLRPGTLELYRAAADLFLDWARHEGIESTEALTSGRLPAFRDHLLARRKQGLERGSARGSRRPTREKLSPRTSNWKLRAVKTLLGDLRLRGMVPLSRDDISDALKPISAPLDAPEFLQPAQLRQLLEAALRHDAATFAATRDEHAGARPAGTTPRYEPIAPFVAFVLLTGMRLNEALLLRWNAVELDALDAHGNEVGEIRLKAGDTKTARSRIVRLDVSPAVRALLKALHEQHGDAGGLVFGRLSRPLVEAARRRLVGMVPASGAKRPAPRKPRKAKRPTNYGAPTTFGWQLLRSTCATYQCNAPSLFGDAAAFCSAKRLGHSVTVAERHYAGLLSGISRDARTLEAAMQVEDVVAQVVESATAPRLRLVVATSVAAE